jgi:RNA polymerase-binding protein DksA
MDLEHFKNKLEKEKETLEKNIAYYSHSDETLGVGMEDSITDDLITEQEGHDRLKATKSELEKNLEEVKLALEKTKAGTFGICENCGKEISKERLEIMPTARYCLSCSEKFKK